MIDESTREVHVSRQFDLNVRNFTTAHELGHAVLHRAQGLHRDRALDGTQQRSPRNRTEWQADVFATLFLMPEKLVRSAFQHQFKTQKFTLNEDTAFALNLGSIEDLRARCSNVRDLSRLLARATFYDGEHFGSLAQQFRVSVETMAIRLEELDLVGL